MDFLEIIFHALISYFTYCLVYWRGSDWKIYPDDWIVLNYGLHYANEIIIQSIATILTLTVKVC